MKHDQASFARATPMARLAYTGQGEVEDRIQRFLPLVRKAAWHIYGAGRDGMEVEDLIQVGLVALTDCAQRHSGPSEDGFAAYAKMRVRGAMFDVLRKSAPTSRGAMKRLKEYDQAKSAFLSSNGREPTSAELADTLGLDRAELFQLEQESVQVASIDVLYDDHNTAFADQELDPFQALVESQNSEVLARCISQLPDRLKLVLQLYFVEELNLSEISEILDVSVPRIHQLKASALGKMREMLE